MPRQIIRPILASLRRGPNARNHLGPEEDARALWRSYEMEPIHPFVIQLPNSILDGNRRHWGAELEGRLDCEVDCLVFEGDPTPQNILKAQFCSAVHRADLSLADKCLAVIGLRDASPGKSLKDLSAELAIDPTMTTKLIAFERCIERVKEEIRAGRLGLRDMVCLGGVAPENQHRLLEMRLARASVEAIEREAKAIRVEAATSAAPPASAPEPKAASDKKSRARYPSSSGVIVSLSGVDLNYESSIEALKEAIGSFDRERRKGTQLTTAQKVWAEQAAKREAVVPVASVPVEVANGTTD